MILSACTKTVDNNAAQNNSASLWPLKTGNVWVYQDSSFDANGNTIDSYSDSSFISNQTTNSNGITLYAYNDALGWFGASGYVGVDGSNNTLSSMDSINTSSYLFFSWTPSGGILNDSTGEFSNSNSAESDMLYGFKTTFNINGYTCYKNLENVTDVDGNVIYANVYYVSPGIGVVRIEEYSLNPNSPTYSLYLDYSQTLKSYKLN